MNAEEKAQADTHMLSPSFSAFQIREKQLKEELDDEDASFD